MGQNRQFKSGQKAPNNGVYLEVGETGDNVVNPKKIKLKAGESRIVAMSFCEPRSCIGRLSS